MKGDRVVLACVPWAGTIARVRGDLYDVDLDNGGKAKGMTEDDLRPEPPKDKPPTENDERERAKADKSWPPKSMETKVPEQHGGRTDGQGARL